MVESRMAAVPALVEQMRREDREFISAYTVAMFSECSRPEAAVALTRLGFTPAQIGTLEVDATNCQLRDGPLPVIVGERVFTVLRGRRWTRVPEYLSNGQLTARFFVDEARDEVRLADSWTRPKAWPLGGADKEFVLAILAAAEASCKWCGQPHERVPDDLCPAALAEYRRAGALLDLPEWKEPVSG